MLLRCDIRKENVVYGLLLVCMQHDDNYPDIEGKCSVNENKRRSVFAHTLLTENLAQCRIMIALGNKVKNHEADLALILLKANCRHITDLDGI